LGEEVKSDKLMPITFECRDGRFMAFLSVEGLLSLEEDPEPLLRKATAEYEQAIRRMRLLIQQVEKLRSDRKPIPAHKVWEWGDAIFRLTHQLAKLSLRLDQLYQHLARDLGVKRKRLEKVVILRRYLPRKELIPEGLNWGRLEKGTRKAAERLRAGLPVG
jgi:hypothetical protein